MDLSAQHIAQINIARMRYERDDARMAPFMDNLDRINAIADAAPGFVWRLQDDTGNATDITAFDDPRMLINLSVWKSVEALHAFVFKTVHKQFLGRRDEWFEAATQANYALWPIKLGHQPNIDEGIKMLETLRNQGPSPRVFDFSFYPIE